MLRTSGPGLGLLLFLGLTACRSGGRSGAAGALADSATIYRDIAYLASDKLEGRATGSPGNDSAARFIAARFQRLGLKPLLCDSVARDTRTTVIGAAAGVARDDRKAGKSPTVEGKNCRGTYLQRFNTRSIAAAHAGITTSLATANVVAMLSGSDPKLRDQYVVIGAHHDHLGRMGFGVLDVDSASAIHNGADDNASGTAAVLEIARLLSRRPPARSVIFVTFSGEELGLLGSQYFVDHPPVPLEKMVAMINFDMVGRLRDRLIVYGVATADEMPGILDSANVEPKLKVTATGDGFGSSDHSSFFAKGIPVLHFFTDVHPEYHRSIDDIHLIDAGGEARVVSMAARVVRRIADGPGLTFRRPQAPVSRMSACRGNDVSAGTIPNMGATDVGGMKLSGVREGGPAQKGGLKAGDIILEFGGARIKDLYEYTDALCSHKPGETVSVVVNRSGEILTLSVTLGKRGT